MCDDFFTACIISRPFIGWMLDNGKKKVILLIRLCGMVLMSMRYLLVYAAFSSIILVIVFRMAHGCALACSKTSTSTIATDIIPHSRFSEGMGMFGMATALATVNVPSIGEILMHHRFYLLLLAATLIMIISLILFSI